MNERSGNRIYDISGNGNNGDFGGNPLWVPGDRGQALAFNGVNDYVNCGNSASVNFGTGDFCVVVWFKTTTAIRSTLISKRGNVGNWWIFQIMGDIAGQLLFGIGNPYVNVVTIAALWNDNNLHQAIVFRTGSTVQIYVDGKFGVSGTNAGFAIDIDNTFDLEIGRWLSGNYFPGFTSSVSIYNRAFSAQEVLDHYINPYGFIYQPNKYWLTTPLKSAVNKFTAERIDTHFIAEDVDTHFVAES